MEYRGYEIEKFYSKEPVPKHIVKAYYQDEKSRIDRMIEAEEIRKEAIKNGFVESSVDEDLKEFFEMF